MDAAIVAGAAANVLSNILHNVLGEINRVLHLAQDVKGVRNGLDRVKTVVGHIKNQLEGQQINDIPKPVTDWLESVQRVIKTAESILQHTTRYQRRPLSNCFTASNPLRLSHNIRDWKKEVDLIFQWGNSDFSMILNVQRVVSTANETVQYSTLLQPLPQSGFVGSQIERAELQLQHWLMEDQTSPVIGVYGMGGVGKTSLLRKIFNDDSLKKWFDVVIWARVSQNTSILHLQDMIAESVHVYLGETPSEEVRKMKLYASLKNRRFLLILDDVWHNLNLENLGVSPSTRGAKIVVSSRSWELCKLMKAERCMRMEPLSKEEGWNLFCRGAFGIQFGIPRDIENIAREVVDECKGLPLAINVVSAALREEKERRQWELALSQMRKVDPAFATIHPGIEPELYQPLKLSYEALPDDLKICFLYFAVYPEDRGIVIDELIEIWIAEGLVRSNEPSDLMDTGYRFLKVLKDRCLIDVTQTETCKIHDVLRDLAIHIAEREHNCLFRADQKVNEFRPKGNINMSSCTRISVMSNTIQYLPTTFDCPTLRTLVLAENNSPKFHVPESFLCSLTSLNLLDLSKTSLPTSVGKLKGLVLLRLRETRIKDLPATIGDLHCLQFLDLSGCKLLISLPDTLSQLRSLIHLNLRDCKKLHFITRGISQLTCLERLDMRGSVVLGGQKEWDARPSLTRWYMKFSRGHYYYMHLREAACFKDLKNLTNLKELYVEISSAIGADTMGSWPEMRRLWLDFEGEDQEDLPDMQSMKKLEAFTLNNCDVVKLPDWLSQFENLRELALNRCKQLQELHPLGMLPSLRKLSIINCIELRYLRLERYQTLRELFLSDLPLLESMAGPPSGRSVLEEGALTNLEKLTVSNGCDRLKRLPRGFDKLKSLKALKADKDWWDGIVWEDESIKGVLEKLYVNS